MFTLLGLQFGFPFLALGRLQGGDVFTGCSDAGLSVLQLHTAYDTGYGNLVPAGDIGQILAVFDDPR